MLYDTGEKTGYLVKKERKQQGRKKWYQRRDKYCIGRKNEYDTKQEKGQDF